MNKKTILILAALIPGLAVLAGCQRMPVEEKPEEAVGGPYTLTLEATKAMNTKALSLDGNTLDAHWRTGETVAVYLGGDYKGVLTATADGTDATKATLTGELTPIEGIAKDAVLTLLFPRKDWDYTGQDGSLPEETSTLSTRFDYATASVTVASVSGSTVTTTGEATFANEQSMYRFGFKVGGAGDALEIHEFTVSSTHNALVRSRSWNGTTWTDTPGSITVTAASPLTLPYASLRNTLAGTPTQAQIDARETIDTYSFNVIGADNALYLGEKAIPAQVLTAQGRFISAQSIPVTKTTLAKSGTATEVW